MSDTNRRLSEISHLFLSDVRDKQTNGTPRPTRIPPGGVPSGGPPLSSNDERSMRIGPPARTARDLSIDLTPEEFALAFACLDEEEKNAANQQASESTTACSQEDDIAQVAVKTKPIHAVLAQHLGDSMTDWLLAYAADQCTDAGRVGVIVVDATGLRVSCVERNPHIDALHEDASPARCDAKQMRETLTELNCDVDRWLLVLPTLKNPEARRLLATVNFWTLLCGTDADGVTAAYRALKSVADVGRPNVSVTLLPGAESDAEAAVFMKLRTVCDQFLRLPVALGRPMSRSKDAAEHVVLDYTGASDDTGFAAAPQWDVVADFAAASVRENRAEATTASPVPETPRVSISTPDLSIDGAGRRPAAAAPVMRVVVEPAESLSAEVPSVSVSPRPAMISPTISVATDDSFDAVLEFTGDADILRAVLRGDSGLAEISLKAPACPDAILAVSRDRRFTLMAVSRSGLGDLRSVATAYRWLADNRTLIALAFPQFAVDATAMPKLCLFVDSKDADADVLQPLLASGNVTVQTYRKLRWGDRTGLLLDAA